MEEDSQLAPYTELQTLLEDLHAHDLLKSCSLHGRPLESVCFTCDKANCLDCLEACRKAFHHAALVTDEPFNVDLQNLMSEIYPNEKALEETSSVIQLCYSRPNQLRFLREEQLEKIRHAKRLIVDELEVVVRENEQCVNTMFDSLEREAEDSLALAKRLEANRMRFQNYISLLIPSCSGLDLWRRKANIYKLIAVLREKLSNLKASLNHSKAVVVESSIPENLDYVLKFWIGNPRVSTGETFYVPRPKHIGESSCYIELPIQCFDVALTNDSHLLLAAGEHGLFECCTNGQKLSQWKPLKTPGGEDDNVETVEVISDGRAAVGVFIAKTIFLLRRIAGDSRSVFKWIEDRRIGELRCPPRCLSCNGDVLAVSMWTFGEQQDDWDCGRQLHCMSLSTGALVAATSRDYDIGSIAVTEQAIITSSEKPLERSSGCHVFVIDAHDRVTDLRLWRYELLHSLGYLHSIVPDSTGQVLYASIDMAGPRGGRVAAISLRDGRELRQHVLRFNNRLRPRNLSLDNSRSIMAALCYESGSAEDRMVTLHTFTPL